MWTINTPVACTLISLTGLGVVFYVGIVIAGMSSYACPFQTPASIALRGPWKKIRPGISPAIAHSKRALLLTRQTWEQKVQPGFDSLIVYSKWVLSRTRRMWKRRVRPLLCRPSLPTTVAFGNVQVQESEPWLKPKDLATIRRTNTDDILCVSWILRHITDPEALDAALPLAGEIRWFDDGVNVNPPYDLIVSTFEACFDSARRLYPKSRDRAYYSARAVLWIHTLAMCKSEEFARRFPLPNVEYTTPVPDPDLEHLLRVNHKGRHVGSRTGWLLRINLGHTPPHSQWISNLLLHCSWAIRTPLYHESILYWFSNGHETKTTIPLNTTINRILVWCAILGSPVEAGALKVQDKSYDISYFCSSTCSLLFTSGHTEPILDQLSKAVLPAINGTPNQQRFVQVILGDLVKLETTPERLMEITYEWCSVIYKNREILQDWESLLLVCLEIGFRRLDFQHHSIKATITHTEHHRGLVDVVFESQESEAIADLLHAWTTRSDSHAPAVELLSLCAVRLVDLQNLEPLSPRLRRLVIRFVELTEYRIPEEVKAGRFIEFLNHLHVTVEDMDDKENCGEFLLNTIQSSEGTKHLSYSYWELLVELAVSLNRLVIYPTDGQKTTTSLIEAKEWSKLECWMGVVWILLPEDVDPMTEGDLGNPIATLFRQRPGAVQKLEQWVERWSREHNSHVPQSFQQICKQAHEAAKQDAS